MYALNFTQMMKMLKNLNLILDKAAGYADHKKFDVGVLMEARLAPDQFNLIKQVQIACDTAKLGASRLTGKEAPSHADDEKTFADVKARINSTMTYLQTFSEKDFTASAAKRISQPRWEGKSLSGEEYMVQHVIPNFYFHVMTVYSILRHNGVDIGKKDYLGPMPYQM